MGMSAFLVSDQSRWEEEQQEKGKEKELKCVWEREREREWGEWEINGLTKGVCIAKRLLFDPLLCHIYITFVLLREWLEIISLNFSAAAVVVFMIVIVDFIIVVVVVVATVVVVVVVVVDATSTTESEKEKPRTWRKEEMKPLNVNARKKNEWMN